MLCRVLSSLLVSALFAACVTGNQLIAERQVTVQQCATLMCISATLDGSNVLYTLSSFGKQPLGWMGMGFGQVMANSPMVIMWPNDNQVIMSQRIAPREVMPTVDPNPPRIATVVDSLTSLSGDNSSFGFSIPANSDTQQFVIIAYGTDSPDSSDPSATLRQHYEFKTVLLDLSQGGTGTTTSGSAAPTKTSSTEHGTNPSDDIPLLPYQRMIVAHAIFCVVGFLLFLPSGALLARYLRTFTPTWFVGHTVAQFWLAGPTIIIGVSLGVKAVTTSGAMHLNDTHKRLGVAIFFLYFVQLILGAVIHWIKPRNTSRRPIQNYAHAVIGLLIIAMAMYQVHDGFQNEWPRTTGRETLSNGVSILYYIWIVLIIILYFAGLVLLRRQFNQENQPKRVPMRDGYIQYQDQPED